APAREGGAGEGPEGGSADRDRRTRRRRDRCRLGHRRPGRRGGAGGDRGAPSGGGGMSATLTVHGPPVDDAERVLTPAALAFVADLARRFEPRRREPLDGRRRRQEALRRRAPPGLPPPTP